MKERLRNILKTIRTIQPAKLAVPAVRGRLKVVLPLCALTLALSLTAALAALADLPPGSAVPADELVPSDVSFESFAPLDAEGYRLERIEMLLNDGWEAEEAARNLSLDADGFRLERYEARWSGGEPESPPEAGTFTDKIAVIEDTVYAFEEAEARWIVFDTPTAGGSDKFSASENAEKVYQFAKEVLGVNTAAACGILSNIRHESNFNPHAVFVEADGRVSYGICQWNAGRLIALREYCGKNGYDPTTLSGQLQYLQYELKYRERAAFNRVKSAPDTANGAYEAGYNWAKYFERCAARYYPARAEMAYSTYWLKYGNASEKFILSIIGETFPAGSLQSGSPVELCGVIRSDVNITRVSAFVNDASGAPVLSYKQDWNRVRYDIQTDGLNQAFSFGSLPNGRYTYVVYAADASGTVKALIQSSFAVEGSPVPVDFPDIYVEVPTVEEEEPPPALPPSDGAMEPEELAPVPTEAPELPAPGETMEPLPDSAAETAVPEDLETPEPAPETEEPAFPEDDDWLPPGPAETAEPAAEPEPVPEPEPTEDAEGEWLPPVDPTPTPVEPLDEDEWLPPVDPVPTPQPEPTPEPAPELSLPPEEEPEYGEPEETEPLPVEPDGQPEEFPADEWLPPSADGT